MSGVYLFCLTLGFGFTMLSAVLGWFGGGDGGHGDASQGPEFSHSFEAGGADAHGGVGEGDVADSTSAGSLHLPLLSPTVLSAFVAAFGGTGLLLQKLFPWMGEWMTGLIAGGSATAMGVGLAYLLYKITSTLEANRVARASDALASQAEVTVTIPVQGAGEIAYVSANTRQTLTARSGDGREHKQGGAVRVLKVADGVAYVTEALRPSLVGAVVTEKLPEGQPIKERTRG
jgi:hypothetical protein